MTVYTVGSDCIAFSLTANELAGEEEMKTIVKKILKDNLLPVWDNFVVEIYTGVCGSLCLARPKPKINITVSPFLLKYLMEYFTEQSFFICLLML